MVFPEECAVSPIPGAAVPAPQGPPAHRGAEGRTKYWTLSPGGHSTPVPEQSHVVLGRGEVKGGDGRPWDIMAQLMADVTHHILLEGPGVKGIPHCNWQKGVLSEPWMGVDLCC